MNASLFETGSRRYEIAMLHDRGLSESEAYEACKSRTMNAERKWVFRSNENGRRVAKPMSDQLIELRHEIARTYSFIARRGNPNPEPISPPVDPTPIDPPKPIRAKGKLDKDAEKNWFYSEWKRLRAWISETSERVGSAPIDSLDTMRPLQGAKAMIDQGISAKLCVYAMTLHWSQASRDAAGIETMSFADESGESVSGSHSLTGYVQKLYAARIPVMLIGPAGTGKSFCAHESAGTIQTESHPDGLPYGETPMTPGASRGDLLGRHTLDGFITSQFVEIYSGGGVFNFEEIDASDPSMLIVVNNALASQTLFNSANGESYAKHSDFIAVATANTFGLGADAKYTGREKLDLATIDRFRMGRVLMTLDEELARNQILA